MTADIIDHQEIPAHGGDVYHLARSLGLALADLLDFSANINPLGFPPGITAVVQAALPEIVHYPDRRCLALREALAAYHEMTPAHILVGNGSTELIFLVVRALRPRRAMIVAPAFSEYETALRLNRVPVDFHLTREEDNFTLAGPLAPGSAELLFLANPASPSGALAPPDLILQTAAALADTGGWLFVDEAFIDFVEEASLKRHLADFPNLLILRSFTKFFGIPGLRLGYLLAAPEVVARLSAAQEPWSVNTLAQAVGRACLADQGFIQASRTLIRLERQFLHTALKSLAGLHPYDSAVNYLLVKLNRPGWTATSLRRQLLAHRLVIRDASNFRGLDERFFRLAVRRREENQRLLTALRTCFQEGI